MWKRNSGKEKEGDEMMGRNFEQFDGDRCERYREYIREIDRNIEAMDHRIDRTNRSIEREKEEQGLAMSKFDRLEKSVAKLTEALNQVNTSLSRRMFALEDKTN